VRIERTGGYGNSPALLSLPLRAFLVSSSKRELQIKRSGVQVLPGVPTSDRFSRPSAGHEGSTSPVRTRGTRPGSLRRVARTPSMVVAPSRPAQAETSSARGSDTPSAMWEKARRSVSSSWNTLISWCSDRAGCSPSGPRRRPAPFENLQKTPRRRRGRLVMPRFAFRRRDSSSICSRSPIASPRSPRTSRSPARHVADSTEKPAWGTAVAYPVRGRK